MAAGQFDKALEQLERALGEYPGLNALRDLVEGVASKKADHQRKLALSDAIEQGGALVASERFTEALAERIDAFVRAYGERAELSGGCASGRRKVLNISAGRPPYETDFRRAVFPR